MGEYLKAIVAAVGALAMTVTAVVSDQAISFDEVNGVLVAFFAVLTAVGVYAAPNKPA
jgi:hypothetical protein